MAGKHERKQVKDAAKKAGINPKNKQQMGKFQRAIEGQKVKFPNAPNLSFNKLVNVAKRVKDS